MTPLSHPHLRWVRPARQARSRQTAERLLDAAEGLLADKGFRDIGVAEIAARAGCSVGAFYARFPDKEALLRCLVERFFEETEATAREGLDPARWEEVEAGAILQELVAFLVESFRERAGLLREVFRGSVAPEVAARREAIIRSTVTGLADLLRARGARARHPDPEAALAFALRAILAALTDLLLFAGPEICGLPRSDERLVAELCRLASGYLGLEAGAAGGQPASPPETPDPARRPPRRPPRHGSHSEGGS